MVVFPQADDLSTRQCFLSPDSAHRFPDRFCQAPLVEMQRIHKFTAPYYN